MRHRLTARRASGYSALSYNRRIPSPSKSLLSHFHLDRQKKFRWQFLDREADGVFGAGQIVHIPVGRRILHLPAWNSATSLAVGDSSASAL
jgi:hypothetical protein